MTRMSGAERIADLRIRHAMMRQQRLERELAAPKHCDCIDCAGVEAVERQMLARNLQRRREIGEPPF